MTDTTYTFTLNTLYSVYDGSGSTTNYIQSSDAEEALKNNADSRLTLVPALWLSNTDFTYNEYAMPSNIYPISIQSECSWEKGTYNNNPDPGWPKLNAQGALPSRVRACVHS